MIGRGAQTRGLRGFKRRAVQGCEQSSGSTEELLNSTADEGRYRTTARTRPRFPSFEGRYLGIHGRYMYSTSTGSIFCTADCWDLGKKERKPSFWHNKILGQLIIFLFLLVDLSSSNSASPLTLSSWPLFYLQREKRNYKIHQTSATKTGTYLYWESLFFSIKVEEASLPWLCTCNSLRSLMSASNVNGSFHQHWSVFRFLSSLKTIIK